MQWQKQQMEAITIAQGRSGVIIAGWLAIKKGPVQGAVDQTFNHTH